MHAFSEVWNLPIELRSATDRVMPETDDDQQLLRQLARGDERAFETVYHRYQRLIHGFAWHMTGDRGIAEDVTQEVFLMLIRKPGKYDPAKGSLRGYLFGIARNLTRRRIERQQSLVQLADEGYSDEEWQVNGAPLSESHDLLAELTQQQLIEKLHKAILSLPAQYREVIVLCDLEHSTQAEVAQLLECSPGTIASRMHRGKAMLTRKMGERG